MNCVSCLHFDVCVITTAVKNDSWVDLQTFYCCRYLSGDGFSKIQETEQQKHYDEPEHRLD